MLRLQEEEEEEQEEEEQEEEEEEEEVRLVQRVVRAVQSAFTHHAVPHIFCSISLQHMLYTHISASLHGGVCSARTYDGFLNRQAAAPGTGALVVGPKVSRRV